jgi:L-arabinonolactonase
MTRSIRIDFFGAARSQLGESPLWDARQRALYWVDTLQRRICRARWPERQCESWVLPKEVGSIALAENGLLAALRDGFYHVHLAGNGTVTPIALPEQGNQSVRFNDGKADRQGRFLAGTMRLGPAPGVPGVLYRLDPDGTCAPLERGIALSNALCFSPTGDRLYFADSLRNLIWRYDYDAHTGEVSDRQSFAETASLGSVPDGATVDAEGYLWVALPQAQRLARFAPDGSLAQMIPVPIPYPSCPAFGDDGLSTLFVTTIADSGHRLRTDHPDAGRVLAITGLGTQGLPEARCCLDPKLISNLSPLPTNTPSV